VTTEARALEFQASRRRVAHSRVLPRTLPAVVKVLVAASLHAVPAKPVDNSVRLGVDGKAESRILAVKAADVAAQPPPATQVAVEEKVGQEVEASVAAGMQDAGPAEAVVAAEPSTAYGAAL